MHVFWCGNAVSFSSFINNPQTSFGSRLSQIQVFSSYLYLYFRALILYLGFIVINPLHYLSTWYWAIRRARRKMICGLGMCWVKGTVGSGKLDFISIFLLTEKSWDIGDVTEGRIILAKLRTFWVAQNVLQRFCRLDHTMRATFGVGYLGRWVSVRLE